MFGVTYPESLLQGIKFHGTEVILEPESSQAAFLLQQAVFFFLIKQFRKGYSLNVTVLGVLLWRLHPSQEHLPTPAGLSPRRRDIRDGLPSGLHSSDLAADPITPPWGATQGESLKASARHSPDSEHSG